MSPSPRAALALLLVGLAALFVPTPIAIGLAGAVVVATIADMVAARRRPRVRRAIATTMAGGVPATLILETVTRDTAETGERPGSAKRVELRQARPPDVSIEPATGWGRLDARVVAHRRGVHSLP